MRKLLQMKCIYLKIFWAFNFELTNFHLFQQKLTPALHDNDFSVTLF